MNKLIKKIEKKRFRRARKELIRKWYAEDGESKKRYDYDLGPDSIVLDMGGYEGQWASDLFARHLCNIHIFEPVSSFANQIENRFRKNDKIKTYPFGLGGSSREEYIHLDADSSSTIGSESSQTETIKLVDAHDWLTENAIDRIALMKINIEGGEYELLERMLETGWIAKTDNLQIQFHNFEDDSRERMENIQQGLQATHRITYQYEFVWENWTLKV